MTKKKNGKKYPSVRRMKLLSTLSPIKQRLKSILHEIEKVEKEVKG